MAYQPHRSEREASIKLCYSLFVIIAKQMFDIIIITSILRAINYTLRLGHDS